MRLRWCWVRGPMDEPDRRQPRSAPLDVIFMPSDNVYEVIERGLAEKLAPEKVPNLSEITPYFAEIGNGYGVVHSYGVMGSGRHLEQRDRPLT